MGKSTNTMQRQVLTFRSGRKWGTEKEIYLKELIHTITETEKPRVLQSASGNAGLPLYSVSLSLKA